MPSLEELVSADETASEIERASEIAREEWEKIRASLALCGDTGDFCGDDFMFGTISGETITREPLGSPTKSVSVYSPTYYPMYLVKNLREFREKFPERNYRTTEALYVYVELVNAAALRLGLEGTLAMGFASGYSNVRTGWIAEKGLPEESAVFSEMFFSDRPKSYDWDFHWTSIREKFGKIHGKFVAWQRSPALYLKESKSKAVVKPFIV